MAKKPEPKAAAESISVRLKCFYSGFPGDPGPGDVISLEKVEAARLIDLGAAEKFKEG